MLLGFLFPAVIGFGSRGFLEAQEMKLTLGNKLALGFGTILTLMLLGTLLSYVKLADLKEDQDSLFSLRFPSTETARKLQRDLNQTQSKGRQAILAGAQVARREAAKKQFDDAWNDLEKDVVRMDELAPRWMLQENRDRLAEIKRKLIGLRDVQEAAMARAASGEHDAVVRAGNDFTDLATEAAESIKKSLGDMSDTFDKLMQQSREQLISATRPPESNDCGNHVL
jgi:CHASE3 domain sensor protein